MFKEDFSGLPDKLVADICGLFVTRSLPEWLYILGGNTVFFRII